jgi:hypothetical protein
MKRSDMIEEIRKVLEMNGKDNGYGELEEALLHTVEHFGMMPPIIESKSFTMTEKGELIYAVHEWETEDVD